MIRILVVISFLQLHFKALTLKVKMKLLCRGSNLCLNLIQIP